MYASQYGVITHWDGCTLSFLIYLLLKQAPANHPDNLALSDTKAETCRCNKLNIGN